MEDIAGLIARMPEHRALIESLVRPFATMSPAGRATDPTRSFAFGTPFLPECTEWPTDGDGRDMTFLVQVNFAEVPPLPGFPSAGLLQWFVGSGPLWGLTNDESHGLAGFEARWYDADALQQPSHDRSERLDHDTVPFGAGGPGTAIAFGLEQGVPSREEIEDLDLPGYEQLREADPDWEVYDPDDNPGTFYGSGDKVGGYPYPWQTDPRYFHPDRCPTLLIQLELGFMMWGDGGSGQLFGDPAALARGDLSSLWWDWACS